MSMPGILILRLPSDVKSGAARISVANRVGDRMSETITREITIKESKK